MRTTPVVNRSRLPRAMPLLLALDDDGRAFPEVDFAQADAPDEEGEAEREGLVFLERTRVKTRLGCCRSVLTLEKGSRFDCPPQVRLGNVQVKGGEVVVRGEQRYVKIRKDVAIISVEKQAFQIYPPALQAEIPADGKAGQHFAIDVSQRDERGETVGGATVVYTVALTGSIRTVSTRIRGRYDGVSVCDGKR